MLGRRLVRLAFVGVLGAVLGVGVYLAYGLATAPRPHAAPGWDRLAEMPIARGETAVGAVDARLFVIGGLMGAGFESSGDVSIFDTGANAWTQGAALPEPRHHAAAAAIDGNVFVSGGAVSIGDGAPRSELWVLRAGASTWASLAPMPDGRFGHRMVSVDGRLYVVGGVPNARAGSAADPAVAVLIYDPGAGAWSEGAPIPLPRDHLAVVVVDGEIWAIGGRASGANQARVDIYDPASDTWRAGPPLPEATSGAAEAAIGGSILISGGEDPGTGRIVERHWRIDTSADAPEWVALEPPPLTVHGAPGANLEGRFVIAGGSARAGGQSNSAWSALTQVLLDLP